MADPRYIRTSQHFCAATTVVPSKGGIRREDQEPHTSRDGSGHGVIQMTTLAKLLAQKQELIARLQHEDIGPESAMRLSAC
jgi:hypothetical protein